MGSVLFPLVGQSLLMAGTFDVCLTRRLAQPGRALQSRPSGQCGTSACGGWVAAACTQRESAPQRHHPPGTWGLPRYPQLAIPAAGHGMPLYTTGQFGLSDLVAKHAPNGRIERVISLHVRCGNCGREWELTSACGTEPLTGGCALVCPQCLQRQVVGHGYLEGLERRTSFPRETP